MSSGFVAGHEPLILVDDVLDELRSARKAFPTNTDGDNEDFLAVLAALTEEVGELNQAVIQYLYEPKKARSLADIRAEAVQVAAMAMRVILDTKLGPLQPYGRGVQ